MDKSHKRKESKKSKHRKKEKKRKISSSSSSSSENEWVEKIASTPQSIEFKAESGSNSTRKHDDWLDLSNIPTFSTENKRKERENDKIQKRLDKQYDPKKYHLELNPYWKNNGTGLPSFKKPSEGIQYEKFDRKERSEHINQGWKIKHQKTFPIHKSKEIEVKASNLDPNEIAAKIVKAEIMGNHKLVKDLKLKLEQAKQQKLKENQTNLDVILTTTDVKGNSQPLRVTHEKPREKKRRKPELEVDEKYSLKEMFEAEKQTTSDHLDKEFVKMAGQVTKHDLSDLFPETYQTKPSNSAGIIESAANQHRKISKTLENCSRCLSNKSLIITFDDDFYLSLPSVEPLTDDHCLLTPVRHVSCTLQLDENEWEDLKNFKAKLTNFFETQDKVVLFFEIAKNFHKYPHMVLECIPVSKSEGELAPIYFKKAIEESETEWSHNKKLVIVKNNDVRKSIPKGLPYFYVSFGMYEGFAHVIEDQQLFPSNFAQEIIGGMLDLDHNKWRKPRQEEFGKIQKRVAEFSRLWKLSDNVMFENLL